MEENVEEEVCETTKEGYVKMVKDVKEYEEETEFELLISGEKTREAFKNPIELSTNPTVLNHVYEIQ